MSTIRRDESRRAFWRRLPVSLSDLSLFFGLPAAILPISFSTSFSYGGEVHWVRAPILFQVLLGGLFVLPDGGARADHLKVPNPLSTGEFVRPAVDVPQQGDGRVENLLECRPVG